MKEECIICCEEAYIMELYCDHYLCGDCADRLISENKKCPFCRRTIIVMGPKKHSWSRVITVLIVVFCVVLLFYHAYTFYVINK